MNVKLQIAPCNVYLPLQLIQTPAVLNDLADRRIFPTHLVEQRDRQCPEYAAGQLAARGGTYPDWFELTKGRSVGYVADRIEQRA